MSPFYEFSATNLQGNEIPMADFKGKVVLIVNTASKCGFTPQYTGLQELYEKYADEGFIVLGFPSNQFAGQEPGENNEIAEFCSINYGVTFPMFEKTKVNGVEAHPIFQYLCTTLPGMLGKWIKWNFTKFLIDRRGKPLERFAPTTTPESLATAIEKALHSDNEN